MTRCYLNHCYYLCLPIRCHPTPCLPCLTWIFWRDTFSLSGKPLWRIVCCCRSVTLSSCRSPSLFLEVRSCREVTIACSERWHGEHQRPLQKHSSTIYWTYQVCTPKLKSKISMSISLSSSYFISLPFPSSAPPPMYFYTFTSLSSHPSPSLLFLHPSLSPCTCT